MQKKNYQKVSLTVESLEPRVLLAGDLVISEFAASNQEGIRDGDGRTSDWIEIFNEGRDTINLAGWRLTDDRATPKKWTFPDIQLAKHDYLNVFASGRDEGNYVDAAGNLHTNFRLRAAGEYLAIIDPNGVVSHEYHPAFPAQHGDISYGIDVESSEQDLIEQNAPFSYYIPTDEHPQWTEPDFELDDRWKSETSTGEPLQLPFGFDRGTAPSGLIAFWDFDHVSDRQLLDLRNAHHGEIAGPGNFQPSVRDDAGQAFSTSDSRVRIPHHAELNSASFTLTAWVRSDEAGQSATIITNELDIERDDAAGFSLQSDRGRWLFRTGDGSKPWHDLKGTSIPVGTWVHVAITFDAATNEKRLLINGQKIVGSTSQRYEPNSLADFFIGSPDSRFQGAIDDVGYFSTVLSDASIRELMNQTLRTSATGELTSIIKTNSDDSMTGSVSAYLRIPFDVRDVHEIDSLTLEMQYDDGFVAYLNGTEIARRNAPDELSFDSRAVESNPRPLAPEAIDISVPIPLIDEGDNLLAIHGLNVSETDLDFLVAPRLVAGYVAADRESPGFYMTPTPGEKNDVRYSDVTTQVVEIRSDSRVFTAQQLVSLYSGEGDVPIYYTADGSLPNIDSTRYHQPILLGQTTQIRARVIELNKIPGPVTSDTFLKVDLELSQFSAELPVVVIDNNGQGRIPNSGWNQTNAGIRQVTRQTASISVFEPMDGTTRFDHDVSRGARIGIRVRGAFSSSFAEPGYSMEIWSDGRDADHAISLFGMAPAADWVLYSPNHLYDETLIDNAFMFELSNQAGNWAPKVQYIELFINTDGDEVEASDYVGLYAVVEKVERTTGRLDFERFSPDGTAGGWLLEINRMDSITEDGQTPKNFHTAGPDGRLHTPRDLTNASGLRDDIPRQYNAYINFDDPNGREVTDRQRDAIEGWFQEMEDVLYGRVQGVDWRDAEQGYQNYIDVDSFIDYLIFNDLSKNGDGLLISMWIFNPDPNNGGKLKFGPIWDVDLGSFSGVATDSLVRRRDRLWYGRLFDDPDFTQRYTDRWHSFRQGPLSDENMSTIISDLQTTIGEQAVLRDGVTNWETRLKRMQRWVTTRANAIDRSHPDPPAINPPSGMVERDALVELSSTESVIYYRLDGTDPRASDGRPRKDSRRWSSRSVIPIVGNMTVTARSFTNNRWSAPVSANYQLLDQSLDADFNDDGELDENDIAVMCSALRANDLSRDLNEDGAVDHGDLDRFLGIGWNTNVGDSDLDGVVNSADLILAFVHGKYESLEAATWEQGDWNCDSRFDSSDLVTLFRAGSYSNTSLPDKKNVASAVVGNSDPDGDEKKRKFRQAVLP